MNGTATFLEMTAPTQLRPSRHPPVPLEMEEVGPAAAPLLRLIYVRLWGALASGGRMDWPDARWEDELARRGVRTWVARIGGDWEEVKYVPVDQGFCWVGLPGLEPGTSSLSECRCRGSDSGFAFVTWG